MAQPRQSQNGRMPPINTAYIQRDYSEGTACQFEKTFPPELRGKVSSY